MYTWGNSNYVSIFQCFEGLPSQVEHELKGKKVIYITCGYLFNIVITNNNEVYSWGMNNFGQLGIGNCTQKEHPCLITSLVDITIGSISIVVYENIKYNNADTNNNCLSCFIAS